MCSFGYYSRLPYLVEMTGLTQYSLARLPLLERGRVGHEKQPTDAWLSENRIHLVVSKRFGPFPHEPGSPPFDQLDFGDTARARILLYSAEVMDRLRGVPGVRFMPIEVAVDAARRKIPLVSIEEAERIYRRLDRYYFQSAGESGRELERVLRAAVDVRRRNPR